MYLWSRRYTVSTFNKLQQYLMPIFVTAVIERNFDQVASCLENTKNWGKFCYEDVLKRRSLTEENYIRGKHLFKFTINKEWPSWTVLNSLFRSKPGLFFAKLSKFFYLWQPWKELDDKKKEMASLDDGSPSGDKNFHKTFVEVKK